MRLSRILFFMLVGLGLLGCIGDSDPHSKIIVTATPDALATYASQPPTPLPPLTVSMLEVAAPLPTMPANCPESDAAPRPRYAVEAELDWNAHTVAVQQTLHYTNTLGIALDTLVFMVEPNRQPGLFTLNEVWLEDGGGEREVIQEVRLDATRLTVRLPYPLLLNCPLSLHMSYNLRLPFIDEDWNYGYFGFSARQTNLGHWMPTLALRDPRRDWYTPQAHFVGEIFTAEAADYEVVLTLLNAPEGAQIAAPGEMQIAGENRYRFTLEKARMFALSVANFTLTSEPAENGTLVEIYSLPGTPAEAIAHALLSARQSLVLFENTFGVAYPYERLLIVQGDFPDGMEFSGLVFVGDSWFVNWNGQPHSWLTVITVHEVAHQWWHTIIGNDPTLNPYLDEAFATYSEFIYFERFIPERAEWWWDFRVRGYNPEGSVDSDIYRFAGWRPYINAVYLRGALMLQQMRDQIGDDAFFDWMAMYAGSYQYQVTTPQDLWSAFPPDTYNALAPVRDSFMDTGDVAPQPTPTPLG